MNAALDLSVVLVSWNTRDLMLGCLASLPAAIGELNADVWVVDNASSDDTVAAIRTAQPSVNIIVNEKNVGYAGACNRAVAASASRYVLLLNSDTVPQPGSIQRLVEFADARPSAAVVGPMLLNPDGSFQGSFADFPSLWNEFLSVTGLGKRLWFEGYPGYGERHARAARRVDYIAGPAMLVRRAALTRVGMMDDQYFLYSEEIDLCLSITRTGGEVWFTPAARIVHFGGQSTRQVRFAMLKMLYRSKVRFFRKFYGPGYATMLQALCVAVLRARWMAFRLLSLRHADARVDPPIRWGDLSS